MLRAAFSQDMLMKLLPWEDDKLVVPIRSHTLGLEVPGAIISRG